MAEKKDRKRKRSQNTENIPGTRNLSSSGIMIEDACLKPPYTMNATVREVSRYSYIIFGNFVRSSITMNFVELTKIIQHHPTLFGQFETLFAEFDAYSLESLK